MGRLQFTLFRPYFTIFSIERKKTDFYFGRRFQESSSKFFLFLQNVSNRKTFFFQLKPIKTNQKVEMGRENFLNHRLLLNKGNFSCCVSHLSQKNIKKMTDACHLVKPVSRTLSLWAKNGVIEHQDTENLSDFPEKIEKVSQKCLKVSSNQTIRGKCVQRSKNSWRLANTIKE